MKEGDEIRTVVVDALTNPEWVLKALRTPEGLIGQITCLIADAPALADLKGEMVTGEEHEKRWFRIARGIALAMMTNSIEAIPNHAPRTESGWACINGLKSATEVAEDLLCQYEGEESALLEAVEAGSDLVKAVTS